MPLYFLHVQDGDELVQDSEGQQFDDLEAAKAEAILVARELMAEALRTGRPIGLTKAVLIEEAEGGAISRVSFADALPSDTSN